MGLGKYLGKWWLAGLCLAGWRAGAADLPVYHTSGRFLLDPCGDTVVIRGVEQPVDFEATIPEIAKSGVNFVRLLFHAAPADYPTPAADVDKFLGMVKAAGFAADVSIWNLDKTGGGYVIPEYLAVLKKYEDIITLHAQGEGDQDNDTAWVDSAKKAIDKIRGAGLRCPLFVLSRNSGRNPQTVLQHGQEVVDHDPLHSVLLGVQLYWGYDNNHKLGWWGTQFGMTDKQAIDSFALQKFPIVAGIDNHDPYGDPWLDYETQLTETAAKKVSWMWWDWDNPYDGSGKYHISTTGKYGDWGVVAAGAPDLDKLTITGGGATQVVEGEAATKLAAIPHSWGKIDGFKIPSGGSFLCCSNDMPDWAEWTLDGGASGGQRTVAITYCNGDQYDKPLKAILNGDTVGTYRCGNSGPANDQNEWRSWKDESLSMTLKPGANTLRLYTNATAGIFDPYYGLKAMVTSPGSVKNTSKRTGYMVNHKCGTTGLAMAARALPAGRYLSGYRVDAAGRAVPGSARTAGKVFTRPIPAAAKVGY